MLSHPASCFLSWSTSSPQRGRKREGNSQQSSVCFPTSFIPPKQLFQMQLFHRWESWGLEQLYDTEGYSLHTSSLERMCSQLQLTHGCVLAPGGQFELWEFFPKVEVINFDEIPLIIFSFMDCAFVLCLRSDQDFLLRLPLEVSWDWVLHLDLRSKFS